MADAQVSFFYTKDYSPRKKEEKWAVLGKNRFFFFSDPWLTSDIAGTPFGNRNSALARFVPDETSITVPWIIMVSSAVTAVTLVRGASTVVELVPLPIAYTCWS